MAKPIVMPKLGYIMTEGVVERWYVPPGGRMVKGEPLFEVSTDKINHVVEATEEGQLAIVVPEGTAAEVGAVVAYALAPGESPPTWTAEPGGDVAEPAPRAAPEAHSSAGESFGAAPAAVGPREIRATPAARKLAREHRLDLAMVAGSGPEGRIHEADVVRALARPAPAGAATAPPTVAPRVSPLAARLAADLGVDPETVRGSGPGGRIQREDILAAASGGPSAAPAPGATAPPRGPGREVPVAPMRRVIAERMTASLRQMAQLTLTLDCDVTEAVALRRRLARERGARVGFADMVIKAIAEALRQHPTLNTSFEGDHIRLHDQVNIGLAVALNDGLIVPVIREADRKTLAAIAREAEDLARRARAGRLALDETTGGTFTVSILGVVDTFTPIVNPPEAAILGIGRIVEKPWVHESQIAIRSLTTLNLTIDHRLIDGAPGAAFLRRLRALIERPGWMVGEAAPAAADAGD
jgi:pyruvate dehydrogenase E2 component (dihydrolipoamide acetyltransferase)